MGRFKLDSERERKRISRKLDAMDKRESNEIRVSSKVEQHVDNVKVGGSNPSPGTNRRTNIGHKMGS